MLRPLQAALCLSLLAVPAGAQHRLILPNQIQDQLVDLYLPKIAVAPDGSYALAAEALIRPELGRDVLQVIVQRFAANGTPVGPSHLFEGESCTVVTSWLSDFMQNPSIQFHTDGTLIVLMQHTGEAVLGDDGIPSAEISLGGIGTDGQLLDLAPDYTSCIQKTLIFVGGKRQDRPRFAITPSGDFFITADGFFGGSSLRNVAIRVLDAAGNELVEEVIPHTDPGSQQAFHMEPDVATNGQIVLSTWYECPLIDNQGNANTCDISAQFASISGGGLGQLGGNVIVNSGDPPGTLQLYPSAAMNASGQSVIAWADARDGFQGEIYAQRFDASGNAVGGNLKVSAGQGDINARPELAVLDNGRFMIAWTDSTGGRFTARARTFDAAGNPEGAPFQMAPQAIHSGQPSVVPDGDQFAHIFLAVGNEGSVEIGSNKTIAITDVEEEPLPGPDGSIPVALYPNPFSVTAQIDWHLAETGPVSVRVYDVLGREVARLVDGVQPPGRHTATVRGADMPPGVYFVEVQQGTTRSVKTLVRAE